MRKSIFLFVAIVLVLFFIVGRLIFKALNPKSAPIEIYEVAYLNTDKMQEADTATINHSYNRYVIKAYLFGHSTSDYVKKNAADAFVCVFQKDSLQKTVDTVLLIDSKLREPLLYPPYEYFLGITLQKNLQGRNVLILGNQIQALSRYKYRYANIQLGIDD
jgi:hypothetical protein